MTEQFLAALFKQETALTLEGWDFGYLVKAGRMVEFPLPWNYRGLVQEAILEADSLLDLGTGGGEFLSQLYGLPEKTAATEGYAPNVKVAAARLAPLGVTVCPVTDDRLPFEAASFSLIINRHESYLPDEIQRVLKPGGTFITQQAGGLNDADLNITLGAALPEHKDWCLYKAATGLTAAGLVILRQEEFFTTTRFFDIGAVLYYLHAIPWQIKQFEWERYKDPLLVLANRMEQKGYLDTICQRLLIEAVKP